MANVSNLLYSINGACSTSGLWYLASSYIACCQYYLFALSSLAFGNSSCVAVLLAIQASGSTIAGTSNYKIEISMDGIVLPEFT